MRISVTQQRGVLGVDQTTELEDGIARLVEDGSVTVERAVAGTTAAGLERLAEACTMARGAVVPSKETEPPDAMATKVAIVSDKDTLELAYKSADKVPEEVTKLVRAVLEAPYRDPAL